MRDVAKLAGNVHPSTVSLVLRNSPNISPATAKRVLAAARQIGYRRDPLLDAYNQHRMGVLPHKTSPVVAWISDLDSREELESLEPHRSFWRGGREAAENLHCRLELFLLGKGQLSPERVNGILRARGITALVLAALRARTSRLAFTWPDYSAVRIESPHLPCPGHAVCCDQRQAARLVWRQLRETGASRIGLVLDPENSLWDGRLAASGYLLEQQRADGGPAMRPLLIPTGADPVPLLRDWLEREHPDAVISDSRRIPALLSSCSSSSASLRFASLDASVLAPEVAGALPDHKRAGAEAVEQVVSLMRANQRGIPEAASTTYLQPTLRVVPEGGKGR